MSNIPISLRARVQDLKPKDFMVKNEDASPPRMGKRVCLDKQKTNDFMTQLDDVFKSTVKVATLRAKGKQQRFETLINEETLLLAKYIKNEKEQWTPRVAFTGNRERF